MPNLNEYYQLIQTEKPPFDDDAMHNLLREALERADAEALAATSPTAEAVRHTRLNGTSIVVTSAAIIALTFWGYTSFKTQSPNAPQAPKETERLSNITATEQHTVPDNNEEHSLEQANGVVSQSLVPVFQAPLVPMVDSEEQRVVPSIAENTDNRNPAEQAEQNVSDNKTAPPQLEEKQYWQRGRTLYQQQYSLLDQLTQIALSQVGVKTTFSQLLAPCTLSAALTGKSTSDCVLSFLESQAAQIQDTLIQSFAALALKNKNYTMPSQVRPINAQQPQYHTETIVRPNPQALDIAPKGVGNGNYSQMATYTTVRVIEDAAPPENQTIPTRRAENSTYRQYLLAIQNHIWNTVDKLERPKDSLAQPKPTTPNNIVAKEFQQQNLPAWFQEALRQHRYSYARSIVDSILIQESNAAELYLLRGDINKAMDSVEASIADYSYTLSLQESGEIYLRRGTQYFTANKREEAYQDFQNAVRLDPKDAQAVFMRGAAAYNLKRFEEACDDWSLAAQMGHPLADSVMSAKCTGYMPKYARTAIAEKQQQSKNFLLLLERVRQGVQALPFDKKSNEPLKLQQQFDSLSYRRISGTCTFLSALSGESSTYCMLHILYAQLLTMPEASAHLFATSLAAQSSQLYNELPRAHEDRQPFAPSPLTNPKAHTLSAPTIRKTSLPQQTSSNAISYKSTQNILLTLLQQIRQSFLMAHPEMAEQNLGKLETESMYPVPQPTATTTQSRTEQATVKSIPLQTYPADSLLPSDFRSEISMTLSLAWAIAERRHEDARRMLDSSLGVAQSFTLYCLRAHLYKAMDSVEASIADYSRALSLQESGEIYLRRGTQYFTANKREEAYQDFQNAVRLDPKDAQAVFMRGAAAYNLKRFEEACDDWHLAAQMGHPLADSVMSAKCAGYMPKYARTAIAEKKQQIKTALLLLEQIKENVKERRKLSLNETSYTLDSLSYKSLGIACDMRYFLEGGTSTFCMVHLLYTMTLELRDPIASDFVRKLLEKIQNFAASSSTHPSASFDQTMRSIDYNKQNVDIVSNIKNIPNGIDKINTNYSLQMQQQNALQKSAENNIRNAPSQPFQVIISNLIDQMEKYILVQYAEVLEK